MQTLKRKNQKALFEALLKVKEELMLLGFISLLLTVFQGMLRKTCIPSKWTNHLLPCRKMEDQAEQRGTSEAHFVAAGVLGHFGRRLLLEGGQGADHCQNKGKVPLLSLEALHQLHIFIFVLAITHVIFSALTMLLGGAKIHQWKHWENDIQKDDAGNGWHTYFWISFIPLLLLLAVGAKLEHVITQLAHEVAEKHSAIEGDLVNAFEIAFFFWILTTYGFNTCIMDHAPFILPRLVIGVIIQLLCSYSTLPLYAIVTQMGTFFKKEIFDEHVQQSIVVGRRRPRRGRG
ncbi:hypothetical protein GUJ93_ZPchr0001g30994 [Zizania palustris]|uniref:MLO-like protein n=1 Tax=Zizania palustris TaxID=103762 RepID=A0A8J5VC44_ZIZPA|nr:hypothetical protein GUJ93_ZPchr0001g30994 [Zizania palustris]